jgi:hypothetical protein
VGDDRPTRRADVDPGAALVRGATSRYFKRTGSAHISGGPRVLEISHTLMRAEQTGELDEDTERALNDKMWQHVYAAVDRAAAELGMGPRPADPEEWRREAP